jgi:hypothetical protein
MAKYEVTFSCGHKGIVSLIGPNDRRKSRIEWYETSGLCPECFKKEKEKKRQAEIAADKELLESYEAPALTGTESQVAWASEIRLQFVKEYQQLIDSADRNRVFLTADEIPDFEREREIISVEFSKIIEEESTARYWIDNRESNVRSLVEDHKKTTVDSSPAEKAVLTESVMAPKEKSHDGVVELKILGQTMRASYQMDDTFRSIVKKLHLHWDREKRCWTRECDIFTGDVIDRAAELTNALLLAGFSVSCVDSDVRNKAQQADFKPECRRWITFGTKSKRLLVYWYRDDKDFYDTAHSLPGAHWDRKNQAISVPTTSWREVQDFAEINGFAISPGAKKAMEESRAAEKQVIPAKPKQQNEEDKLKDILKSSKEVLPDLKDD